MSEVPTTRDIIARVLYIEAGRRFDLQADAVLAALAAAGKTIVDTTFVADARQVAEALYSDMDVVAAEVPALRIMGREVAP